MKRRGALLSLMSLMGSMLLRCRQSGRSRASRKKNEQCSKADIKTLSMAAECIYPEHAESAGALLLGIESYAEQQLNTKHYAHAWPALRSAIAALDETATRRYGKAFSDCAHDTRNDVFDTFARDRRQSAVEAFNQLVDITLEGCFADPKHGGNREMKAWDIMNDALQQGWYIACECGGYAG
jgi:hypothetical protein